MQTNAINGVTSANSGSSSSAGLNRMTSEDFYNLLVTELQQQDPLEPTKTSDMIGQVSQIRSIEQSAQLTQTLQQLVQQQRTAGAGDLLGKYVEGVGLNVGGEPALLSGVVTAIRFTADGTAVLELDNGAMLSANNLTKVTECADDAGATDAANTTNTTNTTNTNAAAAAKRPTPSSENAYSDTIQSWLDSLLHPQPRTATSLQK